jgi:Serine aminopeptidase, S33
MMNLALVAVALAGGACSSDEPTTTGQEPSGTSDSSNNNVTEPFVDEVVDIGGGRGLYVRCTGEGSPTVVMEGGDLDTSSSYSFATAAVSEVTRACVYDRANLGRSDPASGPRGLDDLVGDLEAMLEAAEIPGPYVLVGTSGGGYITAGYAVGHPDEVAGMVFIDVFSPFRNPPRSIVQETKWDHPDNLEKRDFLQVERDAWAGRKEVGDIPVTIITVEYSNADLAGSPFASERAAMKANVQDQRGWLVLSPRAEQVVVDTGHAVEEDDPQLVIDAILDVVEAAQ